MEMKLIDFKLKLRHYEILHMIRERWFIFALALIFGALIAGTNVAIVTIIKPFANDFLPSMIGGASQASANTQPVENISLLPYPWIILLIFLVRGIALFGQDYSINMVGEQIIYQLRVKLYNKIQDMSLQFFHVQKTGVLMSRVLNDVGVLKNMVSSAVTSSVRDSFTIIGMIVLILFQNFKMALLTVAVFPIAFVPIFICGRYVRKYFRITQEVTAETSVFLQETFMGNKIVKAFCTEEYEKKRFAQKAKELYEKVMKSVVAQATSSPIMEVIGGIAIASILWYGGHEVEAGRATVGDFLQILAAVLLIYDPVKKLSGFNNALQSGLSAVDRIYDLLETSTDITEKECPLTIEKKPHSVQFKNVCFGYEGQESLMVLNNVSLDVKTGEVVALVGTSGGGKTSLVNLIPRFYDVISGSVEIDNIQVKDISLRSLRDQIAIVTQEPILFNDSIYNNISYGSSDATIKEVENAARAAFAYDFISSFPQGFQTTIGELGTRLSGGEKQRICIARALLKNAPILILDEATSALDAESEILVQKALENLMEGRTTFIVAHRLSTVRYADRIVVLSKGKIVEEGKQDELLAKDGIYAKLWKMQTSGFDLGKMLA